MEHLMSYPKVLALGHKLLKELFSGDVFVEEKIDGSQISFGVIDGQLQIRSKNKLLDLDYPEKMFAKGVEYIRDIEPLLTPGWIYRGEYLESPSHNTLRYDRIPQNHIMIFDIHTLGWEMLDHVRKNAHAFRLGLETVRTLYHGKVTNVETLREFLENESALGGVKVEGIVVKNHNRFGSDGKILVGKLVSEKFKETHDQSWKLRNPQQGDILIQIIENLRTDARWEKSIQHLQEMGELENSPRDIGKLIKLIKQDILEEEGDNISDVLFKYFWKKIEKELTRGFPEWYKERLMEQSVFEE